MTSIATRKFGAFSKAEETNLVVVEVNVEVIQTSCLHKYKVAAAADKGHEPVAKVVLEKFIASTQTTAKK